MPTLRPGNSKNQGCRTRYTLLRTLSEDEETKMITTITGPNTYAAKQYLDEIKKRHKKTYGDMSVNSFDAQETEFDELAEAVLAVPFLVRQAMVIARNFSSQKSLHDQLIQLIEKAPDSNH